VFLCGEFFRMTAPLLSLRGISRAFGPVVALADVDLDVFPGEVHALLGENGAGKSTLMKVIYGLVQPDAGALHLDGAVRRFASPLDARRAGVGMVHQEFALVDALSVAENLALILSPPDSLRWHREQVVAAAIRVATEVGLELGDLDAPVGDLPVGLRQRVEIVKALANRARVLILDEPTAVLTPAEVDHLFAVLDRLRRAGTAILFITHKLREVTTLADRVTVLRHGRVVARVEGGSFDEVALAREMVGELATAGTPPPVTPQAPVRLAMEAVSADGARGPRSLHQVSLAVRAGELFGIAGVDGNGQTELFEVLTGLRRPTAGRVLIAGVPVGQFDPAALLDAGVVCIPPDRQRLGTVPSMSIQENAVLNARLLRRLAPHGLLREAAQQSATEAMIAAYGIRAASPRSPASSLSGGNLQKLIVARALTLEPIVLVAGSPTRGLDVAAAQAVYAALDAALARGAAVLLISTDLDEIVARCHRLAVLSDGRLSAPLERPFATAQLGALLGGIRAA
jgi:simple sugar transport system ATP-binding protein